MSEPFAGDAAGRRTMAPGREPRRAATLTRRVMLARGASSATLALLAAVSRPTSASADQSRERFQALLASALTVELEAIESYGVIAASGVVGRPAKAALSACRAQNRDHARWLKGALERMHVDPPRRPRRAEIAGLSDATSEAAALAFAIALEQRAVAAYLAAVRPLSHRAIMRTIAAALAAHGQQLVVLREVAGQPAVPAAFESGTQA